MAFTEPALVRNIGRHHIVLCENLCYETGRWGRITVPAGFVCDGASIPWLFSGILPRFGVFLNAPIFHDWLYWDQSLSRGVSDWLFEKALADLGMPRFRRRVIYHGVDNFGGWSWRANQRKAENGLNRVICLDQDWLGAASRLLP